MTKKKKMNDQEQIELFKSLLGAVIDVLDLSKSEINELKTTPAELVRMIIAEKNDKIEELSAYVNSVIEIFKALNPTDEEIEKNSDSEEPTHNLIIRKIKEKNDKIKLLEERLSGIRAITNFKF